MTEKKNPADQPATPAQNVPERPVPEKGQVAQKDCAVTSLAPASASAEETASIVERELGTASLVGKLGLALGIEIAKKLGMEGIIDKLRARL